MLWREPRARGHAAPVEADIAAALERHRFRANWTARSLALHTQAVLQGAFILARATGNNAVSIGHVRRSIALLLLAPNDAEETGADHG